MVRIHPPQQLTSRLISAVGRDHFLDAQVGHLSSDPEHLTSAAPRLPCVVGPTGSGSAASSNAETTSARAEDNHLTVLDWARRGGHQTVIDYLMSIGAPESEPTGDRELCR